MQADERGETVLEEDQKEEEEELELFCRVGEPPPLFDCCAAGPGVCCLAFICPCWFCNCVREQKAYLVGRYDWFIGRQPERPPEPSCLCPCSSLPLLFEWRKKSCCRWCGILLFFYCVCGVCYFCCCNEAVERRLRMEFYMKQEGERELNYCEQHRCGCFCCCDRCFLVQEAWFCREFGKKLDEWEVLVEKRRQKNVKPATKMMEMSE
mmetsp:Transcript_8850/g.13405  ORF Transcript_8850/g.13405 Transcript_8850/m.13405 type:complete len:208 (-) Transcript_8850:230-853(-)